MADENELQIVAQVKEWKESGLILRTIGARLNISVKSFKKRGGRIMFFFQKKSGRGKGVKSPMLYEDTKIPNQNTFRSSPARLLLLSKFKRGDDASRFDNDQNWENALNEKPEKVIQNFVREGLLEPGGLFALLDYKYKVSVLKSMLKEKGLKVTGPKEELIKLLIDHDEKAMLNATKEIKLYKCTSIGMELVKKHLEEEEKKREEAEKSVLDLLTLKQYSQAASAVAQFESTQVLARGMGIDWKNNDGSGETEILGSIFSRTPSILKDIDKLVLEQLRVPTAMMYLWGKNKAKPWLSEDLDTGMHFNSDTACHMLLFHAYHLRNIAGYKKAIKAGVKMKGFKISGSFDSCPECKKVSDKVYRRLEGVPDLPHAKCTNNSGCRCTLIADL